MHQYLEAIGFHINNKKELQSLLKDVINHFTHQTIVSYSDESDYCELQKEFGQDIGISICGDLDSNDIFQPDYYTPYYEGSGVTTHADIIIERRYEKEQYIGICEDPRIGISLIFHLLNGVEYMREKKIGLQEGFPTSLTLSGLALKGKILFPVVKDSAQLKEENEANNNRKNLINAARSGDQSAMESLTLDDIDTYSKVSRRLMDEDIFSIVDTYFMPYGVECDLYAILGEILAVRKRVNTATQVQLYQMKIEVNELQFDICVPQDAVLGEPEIGRRFKANIWLQGIINY